MDESYEDILEHLNSERFSILKRVRQDQIGSDVSRGALLMLDKLIMHYGQKMEEDE